MANGFVFYEGLSALDGAPIVAVATFRSGNSKTGDMVQTWIVRADVDPIAASREGKDRSICGDCVHRGRYYEDGVRIRVAGTRTCYVRLEHGPANVYAAYRRGRYEVVSARAAGERVAGLKVRLGSYGDPAAVPFWVWEAFLARVVGTAGYTHQWRSHPELAAWCMASCDSSSDRVAAKFLGFRTFRVAAVGQWSREANEVLCPASAEAGHKTTCDRCMACGGHGAKARCDIVIAAHGAAKGRVVG